MRIPASTNNIVATVPLIMCVKYSVAMTAAINIRTMLSVVPMFFFMIINL